ncbi:unnamed protein product [Arabidopsis arenosa]|uniref:non-specific serine/threonine protein kinase n=1 Tax=Arabidopsis arenosa TaxID=38785 RepID=A0A8S1ZMZ1_ARAAE|nr:unnamed protein product [Arabidopsis arenosa]
MSYFPEEENFSLNQFQSVLGKGFEVKVKIDEITCQECSSSGGICGFHNTTQVCCETSLTGVKCSPKRQPSAVELHKLCGIPFICGDQSDLLYPFWIPGREECGHPDFKLSCYGGFAELNILSVKFRILEVNYTSRIIRLARSDYIGNLCPLYPSNAPFDQNVLLFAPNTELLTIYSNCQDFSFSTPVYDPTYFKELRCDGEDKISYYVTRNFSSPLLDGVRELLKILSVLCSNASIPVSGPALNTLQKFQTSDYLKKALEEGFELGVNRDCYMCIDSGGACGYNHNSSGFICYCNNGPHHLTCGSRKSSHGTVITILIGSASLAGVVLLVIFTLLLRKRKTSHEHRQQNLTLIPLKHYSYAQVKKITKSFAEVVGKGGFGTVYRGSLSDGHMVAVKVLKDSKGNGEDFINEVASMSKTSHVNIVSLLGFCSEGSKRAIIYEYLENGSLDQFISSKTSMNLDCMTMYGIALGVARGLEYLHYGCKTRIVHFDIKPQNVLLDENLCPRVSDFGLAKLCDKKESIMSLLETRGTIGYIAPEMISRVYGSVSHKSDVYSYGMLVLEMIGARNKPYTEHSGSNTSSMYFPEWIYKDLDEKGDYGKFCGNGFPNGEEEITKKMTLVGLWCIQSSPSDRPAMNRVVEMMEENLNALEVPPRPVLQQIPTGHLQESSTLSEDNSIYTGLYIFHECCIKKESSLVVTKCGNITAGFPFWGGNRRKHCGHPLLELSCNQNNSTSLFISDQEFYVLHVDQTSYTLTLAKPDLLDFFCSFTFTNTTLPSEIFEISSNYKSVTFYHHCKPHLPYLSKYTCPGIGPPITVSGNPEYHESCLASFATNVPKNFVLEEKKLNMSNLENVLRKGFEVKVKIDENACQECLSSHEHCGFTETFPFEVICKPHNSPTTSELELHRRCGGPFSCGDQSELFYPFWTSGREDCGHPGFKLDCSGGFAELSISSVKFRILQANYVSGIIRLARLNYISNDLCPQNPINAPFDETVLPFAPNTELLTLYYNCSRAFSEFVSTFVKELYCQDDDDRRNYYVTRHLSSPPPQGNSGLLNVFREFCSRNVSIPASRLALDALGTTPSTDNLKEALEEGFEVKANSDCRTCIDSKGACGYDQTSSRFVCYYIEGPQNPTRNKDVSKGAIAGIGAASFAILGVIFVVTCLSCLIRRRRKTSDDLKRKISNDLRRTTSDDSRQHYLKALIPLKHYSYVQVERITNSFAEVIGKGGFGTVYRGTLCDGRSVAVKILKESQGNGEDFINEVASMSKTSHVNIVTLLGFCSEGSKRAIIYEFMENGSLDKFISSKRSSNMNSRELYRIALGVARGLEYLHHGCRTRIVHFDIKPQNVLLDDNLCPKVSDFGLARLCEKKESILSLLDTRGARNKPSTEDSASNPSSIYFPEWIYKDLEKGDNGRLIKNDINSEEDEIAKKMTLVGLWCIQSSPSDRPPMDRVVEMMEGNLNALEVPPRPGFQIPAAPVQESSTMSEDISAYTGVCSINVA